MKKVLSLFIVFLGLSHIVKAGPGPSSPKLYLDILSPNRDSAYVDTNASSSTYRGFYCRNGYDIEFNYYVISSAVDTVDSVLYFNWTDINTAFPAIRSAFATLDTLVGHFTIDKTYSYITDTSSSLNKEFFVRFDSLLDVDSVLVLLAEIPGATIAWRGAPVPMDIVPGVNSLYPGLDFSALTLDHSTTFTRYLHPLGWQWNIYKLHCPMAWELTMGTPAPGSAHKLIHVIGEDDFGGGTVSPDPDITPNFVQITKTGGTSSELQNGLQAHGDGAASSALGDGHGHKCLSQAIAAGVNSMIGTCPECVGIALWGGTTASYNIDVDGVKDGVTTVPEVQWSSRLGPSLTPGLDGLNDFQESIHRGIAVFSASANTINDEGEGFSDFETNPSNLSQM